MSAAELKQIQAINKVNTDVDNIARNDIPKYTDQVNNLIALCCYILWAHKYSHSYKYLQQQSKRLYMSCMSIDEQLTRLLISLDSIDAEGQIRLQRKQTVVKIQSYTKIIEYLIKRCKRIDSKFVQRCEKYCNKNANDLLTPSTSTESINNNKPIDEKLPVVQRYAHLNLPEYQPKFIQQIDEHGNYIIKTTDLQGVSPNDIEITSKGRIVTIQGVKLKPTPTQQTQSNSAMQFLSGLNPFSSTKTVNTQVPNNNTYGVFQSRQVLPATADVSAMTWKLGIDGTLVIFIPRSVEMYKPKPTPDTASTAESTTQKKQTPPKRQPMHKAAHHQHVSAQKASQKR